MHSNLRTLGITLVAISALAIGGCGGDSAPGAASGDTSASTSDVGVTVVDGPIKNATVCLDKNANGICDTGEPSAKTDALGKVILKVALADVGKYPIVAIVGTDAIDSDRPTTPITTPFTLKAPADKTGVVSPLTTLVQSIIDSTGATSAAAETQVRTQTGINISLFEDFTKSSSTDHQAAGTIARMLVVTTQQHSSALGSAVGGKADDGAFITRADLDKIIQNKLLEILPALLAALADPAVQTAAPGAAKEAALLAQASTLFASTGLTTSSVATLTAINNQTSSTATVVADTPTAGANLRAFSFSSLSAWSARIFTATAAQATPDASARVRSVLRRYSASGGAVAAWTTIGGSPNRQADLHFNGSSWVNCPLNNEDINGLRDAKGNASYNSCDKYETGSTNRASFDIANRTLLEVYKQITGAGYTNISINPESSLGAAIFPANSKLFYQTSVSDGAAVAYYPGTSNYVKQFSKPVSDGGIATNQPSNQQCNSPEFFPGATGTDSTTLEGMIASNTGTPCTFPQGKFVYPSVGGTTYTNADLTDEAWGNSTVSIGRLGSLPVNTGITAPGYYSGNTLLRIAFTGSGINPVTYYSCKERFVSGGTRNCTSIGTGSYTIATKDDARILTLSNPPLATSGLGFQRVFVERGGKIYFGYQNNLGTFNTARLNLAATNALFIQLGLPPVDVNTPLALTKTSYAGDWVVADTVPTNTGSVKVNILNNGGVQCFNTASTGLVTTQSCGFESFDPSTGNFVLNSSSISGTLTSTTRATGNFNFLTGAVSGTYTQTGSTPPSGSFSGARR